MRLRLAMTCVGLLCMSVATVAVGQFGARDPGVRQGPGTGQGRPGLTSTYQQFYQAALSRFMEVDSVGGKIAGEDGTGLGPRFNGNSCAGCHAAPTVGGSSPAENGQVALATLDGAQNILPSFITANGPTREVRFVRNPDGTSDGGVHDLFVVSGRSDAQGCSIQQPDFATAVAQGNAIFRIPTPIYGGGLVEEISDANILAGTAPTPQKRAMGISGKANTSGNDGTVTRFGWKAQNKSLLVFAGEAYNVEQGVTNEVFRMNAHHARMRVQHHVGRRHECWRDDGGELSAFGLFIGHGEFCDVRAAGGPTNSGAGDTEHAARAGDFQPRGMRAMPHTFAADRDDQRVHRTVQCDSQRVFGLPGTQHGPRPGGWDQPGRCQWE